MKPPPVKTSDGAKMGIAIVGTLAALLVVGIINGKITEPATSSARPIAVPSDPCGWQRPSSMTREECERINAVAAQLWLERERERNPSFKPFSAIR